MRRLVGISCLTWAVAAMTIGLASAPAGAAAPRDQGWWTVTNPVPAPPDVPARGLLVQAGPNGPSAVAALLFELDPGATAGTLTLAIAPNSATTPSATLQVCGLIQPIVHPEQGGPMTDAPAYDCSRKATAAPDSNSYKFDASGLVADRLVAVAILPTGPLDRVVLNAPDDNSLVTQPGSTDATPSANDAANAIVPTPDFAPSPDVSAGSSSVGSAPSYDVSLPGVAAGPSTVSPTPASVPGASAGPSSAGTFVPAVSTGPEKATPLLVILLVAGCLGAAGLWVYAGRDTGQAAPV